MSARLTRGLALAAAAAAAGLATACSASVSIGGGLSQGKLEDDLSETVESRVGKPLQSAECESGLKGEVGDTTDCEVVLSGVRATWNLEVTKVEDETISYTWEVAEGSQEILDDTLASQIGDKFHEMSDLVLLSVECPGGVVPGIPGTTVTCVGTTTTGRSGDIIIGVTEVTGMDVGIRWQPGRD